MDLSKLPRLSESPQPPKPAELPATPMGDAGASAGRNAAGRGAHSDIRYAQPPEPGVAAEVWIAAFLGIIFVAMGFRFVRWATATVSGQTFDTQTTWTTGPNAGQMVNYWDLAGYSAYTDMAVFLFGLAVLFEAAVLALVRGTAVWQQTLLLVALVVAATATVVNLALALTIMSAGGGLPLLSLLATAFGGYLAMRLWQQWAWASGWGRTPLPRTPMSGG